MAAVTIYGDTEVVLKVFLISIDPYVPFVYFENLVEEREGCWEQKDFRTVVSKSRPQNTHGP